MRKSIGALLLSLCLITFTNLARADVLQQNTTARNLVFLLVSSTDHITGKTGASPTVFLSKNGAAGGSPSGAVTEIDSTNLPGLYKIAGNATDSNTLGVLYIHASASGADPVDMRYDVVAGDPNTAAVVASSVTGSVASVTGNVGGNVVGSVASVTAGVTVTTNNDKTGYSLSVTPPTAVQIRTEMDSNSTKLANLDAAVSSRSTYAGGAVASVTGNVGGNVVGSVASVTAGVTVTTNNDKTGYGLSAGERTSLNTSIFGFTVDGAYTFWDVLAEEQAGIGGKYTNTWNVATKVLTTVYKRADGTTTAYTNATTYGATASKPPVASRATSTAGTLP